MNYRQTQILPLLLTFTLCSTAFSQTRSVAKPAPVAKQRTAYYIDTSVLDVNRFIMPPSLVGSVTNNAELAELHRIQDGRTPEQVAKAKADEDEEDMFVYKSVLGSGFTAEALPLTATLGEHVKNEQGVVGTQLKMLFAKPRPYQTDPTLHPVCELTTAPNSYPSGHGLTGYLEAFTLAELVPEKSQQILERADDYAYQRMVCGVHYRSDIEASRRASYLVFGYMMASPRFQRDLAAARQEIRTNLGLTSRP